MFMDNKFKVLETVLQQNTGFLQHHSGKGACTRNQAEICVIKECVRTIWNNLPYNRPPLRMIVQMISYTILFINGIPVGSVVSYTLYSHTIMMGTTLDFNKHCSIEFTAYAESHR